MVGEYSDSLCVGHFNESLGQQHWPQLRLTGGGGKEKVVFFVKRHGVIYHYLPPTTLKASEEDRLNSYPRSESIQM